MQPLEWTFKSFVLVNSKVKKKKKILYKIKHIWVMLLKTGQNCDIEVKNSKCEFFNAIIWK